MTDSISRTSGSFRGHLLGVLFTLLAMLVAPLSVSSAQDGKVSRKLLRQIGVMEKIFDQVLIDSPNFLVDGRGNVRGTYLEEFGVLLTFEASLINTEDWDDYDWRGSYRIEKDKDGRTIVIIPDDRDEEDRDSDEDYDDHDDPDSGRSWYKRKNQGERRLYSRGKIELQDAIIDYGDTLTRLKDDHWVAIASFLRDSNFFIDEQISRLVMKVKMRDLRAYASGKIDEDELRSRLIQEEY